MKVGFAWASLGSAAILAGALFVSFLGAGGSASLRAPESTLDRNQFEEILSSRVGCEACTSLDTLTKQFARSEGVLALGVTRRLIDWRLACEAEDLCRAPQADDLIPATAAQCTNAEDDVDHMSVYGEINGLARLVLTRGEECELMSCPILQCAEKANVYLQLEKLVQMLDARGRHAQEDDTPDDSDHAAMERMVQAFRRSARDQIVTISVEFRKLAMLVNGPPSETRGLADLEEWLKWRQRHIHRLADDIDFAASETTLPYDGLSEGLWRIRTLAIVLGNVTDATNLIRETQREQVGLIGSPQKISRDGQVKIYRAWQGLGDAIGEAMLYMARITAVLDRLERKSEWELTVSRQGTEDPCVKLDRQQSKEAATRLRHAIAKLDYCGLRSGCTVDKGRSPSDDPASEFVFEARSDGALRDQIVELREQVLSVPLKDSEPVKLSGEYPSYRPGEAMTIRARGSNNMCLAAGGSWIGIYRASGASLAARKDNRGPYRRRELEAIVEHEMRTPSIRDIVLEAPTAPGNYTVRLFSGPILGGTEIGSLPLTIEKAEAVGCDGFSGHWESKKSGNIWLAVRGNKVTGTYQRTRGAKPGLIIGRVRQNTLKGHWTTEFGSGGIALRLSADGGSFAGTAGWARDQTTGAGDWEGYCVERDSPS